jgi:DNA polymerase-3 subunit epsilon
MKYKRRKKQSFLSNHDKLVKALQSKKMTLDEVLKFIHKLPNTFFDSSQLEFELYLSNGLPLEIIDDYVVLKTAITPIKEQTFCIVDIETNGSNIKTGQIIELGAVKIKNGQILDKFDSLVYAKEIPPYIQEVTNITPCMLEDAPVIEKVLEEFKLFLQDDVFVAHDIKFDYKFISDSFVQYDLGKLENRKLCTIDLSKRTIEAEKYGLSSLKELLNINIDNHHRAYSDALSTGHILNHCIQHLPSSIGTTEELISFCKSDNILMKENRRVQSRKIPKST